MTTSGKTSLIRTSTEIHFLSVRESCTHALPRNTKYLTKDAGAPRGGEAGGALSPRPQLIEGPKTKLKKYGLTLVILLLEGDYLLQIENLLLVPVINHLKSHTLFHMILKMHAYR